MREPKACAIKLPFQKKLCHFIELQNSFFFKEQAQVNVEISWGGNKNDCMITVGTEVKRSLALTLSPLRAMQLTADIGGGNDGVPVKCLFTMVQTDHRRNTYVISRMS